MSNTKQTRRINRHRRIRAKISGTAIRPRLSVFRSTKHIHLQLIDDATGRTLAASSTLKDSDPVTALLAQTAKLGIKSIVFDRGEHQYHANIAKLADKLRAAGLTF